MKKKLQKSVINYFSDLFVMVMVIAWISVIVIMTVMAIYSTIVLGTTDIWSYVSSTVEVPLASGCALWMVKNCVQHAIANNRGEACPPDFPAVEADGEYSGHEKEFGEQEEAVG